MRNTLLALPLTLLFSLAVVGCADLTADDIVDSFLELETDLENSEDPGVRAARNSSEEIAKEQEAQQSLETALQTHDPEDLDRAIELRPYDPTYQLHRAALYVAEGNMAGYFDAAGKAAGLMEEGNVEEPVQAAYVLNAYLDTRDSFERGTTEWESVNIMYCGALDRYKEHTVENQDLVESIFTVATYPSDDCQ